MNFTPFVPEGWPEAPVADFEEYLKSASNDYIKDSYAQGDRYRWRYGGDLFAVVESGKVFVSPDIYRE